MCTEQVVERDTEDVHRGRERLARPMPPVKDGLDLAPVGKILHVEQHVTEKDDVVERDSHTASGQGMPHVPRVAKQEYTLLRVLALFGRGKE